nr:hypothetical protein [Tanacetum cinerariifolium]
MQFTCSIMASNYNFDPVLDKAILFAVGNTLVCDDHEEAKIVIETLSLGKLHRLYGALYSSVKLHLMLNSKRLTNGDGEWDPIIATSLLEASNLLVLKISGDDMLVHHRSNCKLEVCPMELIHPPDDYNFNSTLSFTLQVLNCQIKSDYRTAIVRLNNDKLAPCSMMDRMASACGKANKLLAMVC